MNPDRRAAIVDVLPTALGAALILTLGFHAACAHDRMDAARAQIAPPACAGPAPSRGHWTASACSNFEACFTAENMAALQAELDARRAFDERVSACAGDAK